MKLYQQGSSLLLPKFYVFYFFIYSFLALVLRWQLLGVAPHHMTPPSAPSPQRPPHHQHVTSQTCVLTEKLASEKLEPGSRGKELAYY
jgi:hypothetical protein